MAWECIERDRYDDRRVVVRDQEGQGVEDAADERPDARYGTAQSGVAAAGHVAGVGEPLRKGHAHTRPESGREPRVESRERVVGGQHDREDGRVESDPSMRPLRAGWTRWSRNERRSSSE